MQRVRALVNPAGGMRYHYRAWRHGLAWESYRTALADWLATWTPEAERLLLIGPSAGYCLPDSWLARFAAIDAIEPDRLARWVFRRRRKHRRGDFRLPPVSWHDDRWLVPLSIGGLDRLVADFPDHAVLFSNVLGQLAPLDPAGSDEPALTAWKRQLEQVLRGREFASFHDRLSGAAAMRTPPPGGPLGDDELARAAVATPPGAPRVELDSHQMAGLFPALPRRYFVWPIEPGRNHLIEGIHAARP